MPTPEDLGYLDLRAHDFDIYDLEIVRLKFKYTYSLHFIFISSDKVCAYERSSRYNNRSEIAFIL